MLSGGTGPDPIPLYATKECKPIGLVTGELLSRNGNEIEEASITP